MRFQPTRAAVVLAACLIPLSASAGKKKKGPPPPPPVGWARPAEAGWTMDCYHPPAWGSLTEIQRREARAKALDEIVKQWRGTRNDGITFEEGRIDDAETIVLGRPAVIEGVVQANFDQCAAVASGKATPDVWGSWLKALPGKLTEGECLTPWDFTMFDYLDINTGWQRVMPICKGNKVRVSGTVKDKYRLTEKGAWITVEGDKSKPTVGGDHPCNQEGCHEGQLLLRFVSTSGVESILPIEGGRLIFTAPEHGEISFRINDTSFFDNAWFKNGSIEDHTAIEISPAE